MGLKGDVDEVVTTWRKASWPLKAWLLLSCSLAISSVASLAEAVTKWKGFFKDEIEFYRRWISTPLRDDLLAPMGIHLTRSKIDLLAWFRKRCFWVTQASGIVPLFKAELVSNTILMEIADLRWIRFAVAVAGRAR